MTAANQPVLTIEIIPEPASMLLGMTAIGSLAIGIRRRRQEIHE
jgi:hypothetical protein